MSSLRTSTARGTLATGSVAMMMRVFNVVSMVFLARLLEPADFGLFALAMLLFSTANMFVGLGVDSALIQSKLGKERLAFPAFLLTATMSLLLFLVTFFGAPLWARVLGDPLVEPVVRWLSALVLLEGMASIPSALLRKDLSFVSLSRARFLSQVIDTGLTLILAFAGFGVWSLVYGRLGGVLARALLLWIACPGWSWLVPRRLEREVVGELWRYGVKTTGAAAIHFFNYNWDDWLVGRMLGSTALGFYSKAYHFATNTVEGLNTTVISGVLFPAYARIQDEKQRLYQVYLKSLRLVALIMVPMAMGVLVLAPEAVPVFLGEKWTPMVVTLQIFAFLAIIRPFSASTSPVFMGIGRPDLNFTAGVVVAVVMVPLAVVLLGWGIAGVAIAVAASHVAGLGYNLVQMNRLLPGIVPKMALAVLPASAGGCVMMLGVQLSKAPLLYLAGGEPNLVTVLALILIGIVVYVLLAVWLQRSLVLEAMDLTVTALGIKNRISRLGLPKAKIHRVALSPGERASLRQILERGEQSPSQTVRARVLLLADEGKADREIARELRVGLETVRRTRHRFAEGGLQVALDGRSDSGPEGSTRPDTESAGVLGPVAWSQPNLEEPTEKTSLV